MNHYLKEKLLEVFAVFLICPMTFGILTSCGTEVGNGHAGSSIGELLKNKDSDGRQGGGSTAENAEPSKSGDVPSSSEAPAGTSQSSPGAIQAGSRLLSVLLNSCAFPFRDQTGSGNRVLSGKKSSDQSVVEVAAESSSGAGGGESIWNFSLVEGASRQQYVAVGKTGQGVEISNAVTGKINSTDKCGDVNQEIDVKISGREELFVKKSVQVTSATGISSSLVWYIQSSPSGTFLQQLEIRSGGVEVILQGL